MKKNKGITKRGMGASGLGLKARIKAWEDMKPATPSGPNDKVTNFDARMSYRRPGSQNPRKGGPGR